MHTSVKLVLTALIAVFCICPQSVGAANRVALVVGNSAYPVNPLKNPVNDAEDISAALRALNFNVISRMNADRRDMLDAMDDFYHQLQKADVGLFYFAGHGMQIDGSNYLVPVSARIVNTQDIKYEAVEAGRVLGKMQDADSKLNIVILDACRDNPFRSSVRSNRSGLAFMDAPDGTIVVYATSPGKVALDGTGRNGVYTQYLLKNIANPEFSVWQVFNTTGLEVKQATEGRQTPWMTNSPLETYYLATENDSRADKEVHSHLLSMPVESTLTVAPTPPDAQVRILNIKPKYRPGIALSAGRYHIEVSAAGYEQKARWVQLPESEDITVAIELDPLQGQESADKRPKAATGTLVVTSTPANATVEVNGSSVGRTPVTRENINAGVVKLRVFKSGYIPQMRMALVKAGERTVVDIALEVPQEPVPVPEKNGKKVARSSSGTPEAAGRSAAGLVFQIYKSKN